MKTAKLTAYWKIALAVWSPLIIAALIYEIVYLVRDTQANHEYTKAEAAYTDCMNANNAKIAEYDKSATKQVVNGWSYVWNTKTTPSVQNCARGSVKPGLLGLPDYSIN